MVCGALKAGLVCSFRSSSSADKVTSSKAKNALALPRASIETNARIATDATSFATSPIHGSRVARIAVMIGATAKVAETMMAIGRERS